ncbi:MAG: hypothetical protein JNL08_06695 [Planctomycetes bacterium]|nr:hypothetical protein [Planctomycetota bacterium]
MTTAPNPRPLLCVLAHGIGPRELAAVQAGAATAFGVQPSAALALPAQPVAALLGDLDAVRYLEDLGVAVDRSCLVLRPAGRTDPTAAGVLARRATGPADVTLFEATDVLAQAAVGGPVAAHAAAVRLGELLARLAAILRRGDAPELWCVGLGAPVAVATTFDVAAAWRRRALPPVGDDLALRVTPGLTTVTAANQRALDLAAHWLQAPPFAAHGTVAADRAGSLQFAARSGVAFGRARFTARAPLPAEAHGVVWAPLGDLARRRDLAFADVIARFWLRAAALHADLDDALALEPTAAAANVEAVPPATAASPDLSPATHRP